MEWNSVRSFSEGKWERPYIVQTDDILARKSNSKVLCNGHL